MARHPWFIPAVGTAGVLWASLTCDSPTEPARVARVDVTGRDTFYVTQAVQFVARAYDERGSAVTGRPVVWTSSDTTIATVREFGVATGVRPGTVTLTAAIEGIAGSRSTAVDLAPITRVVVTPSPDSLLVGDSLALAIAAYDSANTLHAGRPASWSRSDTLLVDVSATGVVRGHAAGSLVVRATIGRAIGGAFLVVLDHVETFQLPDSFALPLNAAATVLPDIRGPGGRPIVGRPIAWTSSDPAIVTVSSTGRVVARAFGTALIAATCEGKTDTAQVRVVPAPIREVEIAGAGTMEVGQTVGVSAQLYDVLNGGGTGTSVTWTSSDTAVLRVTPDTQSVGARGTFLIAVHGGSAVLTASAGGRNDTVTVAVRPYPAALVVLPDSLRLTPNNEIGFSVFLVDSAGFPRPADNNTHLELSSDDSSVAIPSYLTSVRSLGIGEARVRVRSAYFDREDTLLVVVGPRPPLRIRWAYDVTSVRAPDSIGFRVWIEDTLGLSAGPVDVSLTTSDSTVAAPLQAFFPAVTGFVDAILSFPGTGAAAVTASSGSVFTQIGFQVVSAPPARVVLDPMPAVLNPGVQVPLRMTVVGTDGGSSVAPHEWRVTDTTVATVSRSGVLFTHAGGRTLVIASSGALSDSAAIVVRSLTPPVIQSVSPDTMGPLTRVTVAGSGFDPAALTAFLDTMPLTVVSATSAQVVVDMPSSAQLGCAPTRPAALWLRSGAELAAASIALATAPYRALGLWQTRMPGPDQGACNDVPGAASHLAVVVNTAPDAELVTDFALQRLHATIPPPLTAANPNPVVGGGDPPRRPSERAAAIHARVLAESRALAARVGPVVPLLRSRPTLLDASAADTLGGFARMRVPSIEFPDFCSRSRIVTARVVYRGARIMILEDVAVIPAFDEYYRAVGMEFDSSMFAKLQTYFGDPLVLDSLLDRNGVVTMLVTPEVNRLGLAGFVVSCDFYPETAVPSSNEGEIMYVAAPTSTAAGFGVGTGPYWYWTMRSVVMHEGKHVTAMAQRLSRGLPLEEVWAEEGSAGLAEEIWARSIYRTTWRGNVGYPATLACDVRPTTCPGSTYSMFGLFALLHDFMASVEQRSPLGPVSPSDVTFYGSSWAFLRWTVDQFAVTEAPFTRAFTTHNSPSAIDALSQQTGLPAAELFSFWTASLFGDDKPAADFSTRLSFPSWHLPSVFLGMSTDFPFDFAANPLRQGNVGEALVRGGVHGGTAAFYVVGPSFTAREHLVLTGPDGGPPPANLRLVLTRIP